MKYGNMNEAIKTTYFINVNKFITKIGLLNRVKRVNINHNGVLLKEKTRKRGRDEGKVVSSGLTKL